MRVYASREGAAAASRRCRSTQITNSTMIVVFLTVMVAMILVRTLSQDIAHYNDAALLDEAKEESVVQCP